MVKVKQHLFINKNITPSRLSFKGFNLFHQALIMGQKLTFGEQVIVHQTFHDHELLANFWVYFPVGHFALTGQYQTI